jgi:hypothetical protein
MKRFNGWHVSTGRSHSTNDEQRQRRPLSFDSFISKTEFCTTRLEISFTRLEIFHLKIIEKIFFASDRQRFTVNARRSDLLDGVFVQLVALFLGDETHLTIQLITSSEIQKSTIILIVGKNTNEQKNESSRSLRMHFYRMSIRRWSLPESN